METVRNKRTRGGNDEPSVYMQVKEHLRAILHIIDTSEQDFSFLRDVTERMLTLQENNNPRYRQELVRYGSMAGQDPSNREIREHAKIITNLVRRVRNNSLNLS